MATLRWTALIPLLLAGTPAPEDPAVDFAAPPGSSKPSLSLTPSGDLLATWYEPRDSSGVAVPGRYALRIAARRGGRWSAPVTVVERSNFFFNWADFPSAVETSDGRWIVHWLEKTAAKSYAYHVRLTSSTDRGQTWSASTTAHSDRSDTEHGFVAMIPRPEGGADLLWLDGRQTASAPPGTHGAMALAIGAMDARGQVTRDTLLDARVCDCCQTALARTADGLLAVYRDRSEAEVRDIAVIRQVGGRWGAPTPVAEDGWVYRACPVNGPSVAAEGRQVAVAWYTGANDAPRVQLARSANAGASFQPPIRVDDGNPLGRAEVELAADGSALVVWLEKLDDRAEWRVKRIGRVGRTTGRWTIGSVPPTRDAGFTRAAVLANELYVAWTSRLPGEAGGVRVHRVAIPSTK